MLEKENRYQHSGYPLAPYRQNSASPQMSCPTVGDWHYPVRPLQSYETAMSMPSVLAHGSTGLDSLEDMLHVASDRHRYGGRRASPQRVARMSHRDPAVPTYHGSSAAPFSDAYADLPVCVSRMSPAPPAVAPPPPSSTRLAADLYVVQLEQEVESLTQDCHRTSDMLCAVSASEERLFLEREETLSRRAVEQSEQQNFLALWGLAATTTKLLREAHWTELIRTAQQRATAAEAAARGLSTSKADLERHVQQLEQQLASVTAASSKAAASAEALFKSEHDKLVTLLEQVPARVRTEMSSAPTSLGDTAAPGTAITPPSDSSLRALVESLAEQLRQRNALDEANRASLAVVAPTPAQDASTPTTTTSTTARLASAESVWSPLAHLMKSAAASMDAVSDQFLRASEEKMRYVEYEMQIAQLVHSKQASLTWAARQEELRTENLRLQENIQSLRTQLKIALNQDATPSASLIFSTCGASGEKRAKLYAQYASPYIPPSLELATAPVHRTAEDLRDEALKLGARPVEAPPAVLSATTHGVTPEKHTSRTTQGGDEEQWQFGTNTGSAKKREKSHETTAAASAAGANHALWGTLSLPSHRTESSDSLGDAQSTQQRSGTESASSAADVGVSAVITATAGSAARGPSHDDSGTARSATVPTTRNASLSGVPRVKRFALKATKGSASDTDSTISSDSTRTTSADKAGNAKTKKHGVVHAPRKAEPVRALKRAASASSSTLSSTSSSGEERTDEEADRAKKATTGAQAKTNAKKPATRVVTAQAMPPRRKNSFDRVSSSSDHDMDSSSATDSSDSGKNGAAPKPLTSQKPGGKTNAPPAASAAKASGLKSLMKNLSTASSTNGSFSAVKSAPATRNTKDADVSRQPAPQPGPKTAAPAKRRNSFDEEDTDEDVGQRKRSPSNSSYTYSYTASVAELPPPKPTATATAVTTKQPVAGARRSSFDDDNDSDTTEEVKPVSKAASKVAPKVAAKKTVTAAAGATVVPATSKSASTATSNAGSPKLGKLKLPSW